MSENLQIASNAVIAKLIGASKETKLEATNLLSYMVDGADRSDAYRSGGWDGKSSFFDYKKEIFPAGFVHFLGKSLIARGHNVSFLKKPLPDPLGPEVGTFDPLGYGFSDRYDYQPETVRRLLRHGRMIAQIATGGGKCLGKDTPVLMFDGSVKAVQDIKIGDQLMGPDSKPRNVLSICHGVGPLYKVSPTKGDSYIVNDAHILSLKTTTIHGKPKGRIVNVNVEDYLNANKTFRHTHKGWRTGVEFPFKSDLLIDSYFLGLLLGDGCINKIISITTMDREIVDEVFHQAGKWGLKVNRFSKENDRAATYHLTAGYTGGRENPLMAALRHYSLGSDEKFIPYEYKTASRFDRLNLLAGLLDTDGYYDGKGFYITQKSERLLDDIVFLARSLGFAAYKKMVKKTCCNNGVIGEYYSTVITGDIEKIPVRLDRRKPNPRLQKKDPLVTGLAVNSIGTGDYYGFEIDGDHLFLLGDFTVTHNTNIGVLAHATIKRPTLFLTTRGALMYQMKRGFEKAGYAPGVLGDGIWQPRKNLNVAMVQTLISRLEEDSPHREATLKLLDYFEFVIGEEAHEAGGSGYYNILKQCRNAHYRLALTATPFMRDSEESNMRLMAAFGPIGITISEKTLIDRGILARPIFKIISPPSPRLLRRTTRWPGCYDMGVVENAERNRLAIYEALRAANHGLSVMILVQRKKHGALLKEMLDQAGVSNRYIFGEDDQETRQTALDALRNGDIKVLIGSTILDVGVDVPAIGMVINAGAGKAEVGLRQRIGRGLREKKEGPNVCFFVDFSDEGNKYLLTHSLMRRQILLDTPGFAENILGKSDDFDYSIFKR